MSEMPKRQPKEQPSEDDSDSSLSSDSSLGEASDAEAEGELVNVELEFFDPSEIDYHGLKMLLRSLLDGEDFPGCSDLVEAIIRQVQPVPGTILFCAIH